MTRLCLVVCLGLGLVSAFADSDGFEQQRLRHWHQWRGPLGTGEAPFARPPLTWDEKTHIQWKTPIPGRGASTPIVWGDRVFVLTAVDTGRQADPKDLPKVDPGFEVKTRPPTTYHQFLVLCLDRRTGRVLWQQLATEEVPHEGHHETHSYAAFSPTTDGQSLYVSFGSRGLYCYDLDGRLLWKRRLGLMHTRYGWGEGASPAVHRGTLVVNWDHEGDSFIVALDATSGDIRWKVDRPGEPSSWATPLIVDHQGRPQVVVNGARKVRGYDLATGRVLWECGGQTINVIPSPVRLDDLVICMSGYRGSFAAAIPLSASGDVTDRPSWRYDRGTPYVPSPVLANGRLWFTQGNTGLLSCLEGRTGKVVLDRERVPGLLSVYASPVAAGDRIYLTGRDGRTIVIKQGDRLEVLASNRVGEGVDASPALVGNQLFLRGERHLFAIAEE
ncbi:MAG: PQQ-binding-like beta-propeller repeat protein [Gemmataceae bacterium]|nr:PQQ-binding-like beta-propeller repeat protein [Gemmataceae bacterium]MDW8266578.1 PQQ-binding-like beta-propeller repeat protein [Gemmataceae bacterium]